MCGITGVFAFNLVGKFSKINAAAATASLAHRGPDHHEVYTDEWVCLGFRRLSIIDTREIANQPMWDESGRYCILHNGEIFNYRELRQELIQRGVTFRTESDTEVFLKLYILEKEFALHRLNGFFATCIYDKQEQSFFIARDRFGIKPLYYLFDDDKFLFGSELQSIITYGIEKKIDYTSLYAYLQLNYIPAPDTIFENVKKLLPGHFLKVRRGQLEEDTWYSIPYDSVQAWTNPISYDGAMEKFKELLEASVQRRLVADVPLGAFLSGGVDSSVVTALASRHKPDLQTFSIGFRDEKYFDETSYANLVARKLNTKHTVFSLTNNDMYEHVHTILDSIDEPFADSSAIAVYILSKETRKHATVALSGDGADELLGGYNKHAAFYRSLHSGWKEAVVSSLGLLWKVLPKSRHAPLSNRIRQLNRYASGANLSSRDRYWHWASLTTESRASQVLRSEIRQCISMDHFNARRSELLSSLPPRETMNDIFLTDTRMVLPNDMLTKVDRMSMANGLEVRAPFLDFELVNYVFSLPDHFKVDKSIRKKILQDSFRDILPDELYNRPKKGFEVPLLRWLRKEMKTEIRSDLLSEKLIREQGIFDYREIRKLRRQLFAISPGDIHAQMWGLIVFQHWWKKWMG